MRRILLYAISRLPDKSEGMTIQFWKECFEHILLQNTTERNTVLQCKLYHEIHERNFYNYFFSPLY